jgi:hypothetical protein
LSRCKGLKTNVCLILALPLPCLGFTNLGPISEFQQSSGVLLWVEQSWHCIKWHNFFIWNDSKLTVVTGKIDLERVQDFNKKYCCCRLRKCVCAYTRVFHRVFSRLQVNTH